MTRHSNDRFARTKDTRIKVMEFLHQSEYLDSGDVVILDCDTQCNFMLLDDSNFYAYRARRSHRYYGGHFKYFPARITAPHAGNWHIVIDLGGGSANIRYSIRVLKSA